jgi:hypothetical protein
MRGLASVRLRRTPSPEGEGKWSFANLWALYLPSGLLLLFGLGDPLCGFSMRVFGHLKIMESKNKARDHTFNSEGWALPGVVLLEVALSCFLLCDVSFIYWRYV